MSGQDISDVARDMADRWVPSEHQRTIAAAMLAADPDADFVVVGLALPGKTRSFWAVGQPVEPAPGFWLVRDEDHEDRHLEYSVARNAADEAAGEQLQGRRGTSCYATIDRNGGTAVFEGICDNKEEQL